MRIGIGTAGCDLGKSGISRYLIHLLRAMSDLEVRHEYVLFGPEESREVFVPDDPHGRFVFIPIAHRHQSAIRNVLWHRLGLPRFIRQQQFDLCFFPAANRRLGANLPCPAVGMVHDISSLHVRRKYSPVNEFYIHRIMPRLVRRLDAVITPSRSTETDIQDYIGRLRGRLHVISHGVDRSVFNSQRARREASEVMARYGIRTPYLLYISRIEHPGKNHVRLLEAFEALHAAGGFRHTLVFAGADWDRADEVHRRVGQSPARKMIRLIGFVPGDDIPGLYGGADFFVFPSLFEGFGMPILEAMACGIPVVCSATSSLPEVGGQAAQYFDPEDSGDMERVLGRVLQAPETRTRMARQGLEHVETFSWSEVARRTLGVLTNV